MMEPDEDMAMSESSSTASVPAKASLHWVVLSPDNKTIERAQLLSALASIRRNSVPKPVTTACARGPGGANYAFIAFNTAEEQKTTLRKQFELEIDDLTIKLTCASAFMPSKWLAQFHVKAFDLPAVSNAALAEHLGENHSITSTVYAEKIPGARGIFRMFFDTPEIAQRASAIGFMRLDGNLIPITPGTFFGNFRANSNSLVLCPVPIDWEHHVIDRIVRRLTPLPVSWTRPHPNGKKAVFIYVHFLEKQDATEMPALGQGSIRMHWFEPDGRGFCARCGIVGDEIHDCTLGAISSHQRQYQQKKTTVTRFQEITSDDGTSVVRVGASFSTTNSLTRAQQKDIGEKLPALASAIAATQSTETEQANVLQRILATQSDQQLINQQLLRGQAEQAKLNASIMASLNNIMQTLAVNKQDVVPVQKQSSQVDDLGKRSATSSIHLEKTPAKRSAQAVDSVRKPK
jgi:hypothetical protein